MKTSHARIAVVGAGASGLTAAHTLNALGYEQVTVFEQAGYTGGKVHSVSYQGYVLEFGAVVIAQQYTLIKELLQQYGIEPARFEPSTYICDQRGQILSVADYLDHRVGRVQALHSLGRLDKLAHQYKVAETPGFTGIAPELSTAFSDFARQRDILPLATAFSPIIVGCGYGYYETVPAAYYLKFMPWLVNAALKAYLNEKCGLALRVLEYLPQGFQALWERVARDLDVRLDSGVTRIVRGVGNNDTQIKVTAGGKTELFDKLIISCTGPDIGQFLDMSGEEATLLQQIKVNRYWVTLVSVEGLPTNCSIFFEENVHPQNRGRLIALEQSHPTSNLYLAYQVTDEELPEVYLEKELSADLWKAGGQLTEIIEKFSWDYFPHVDPEAMRNGFYRQLEQLQGAKGTFFVGGVMNFEGVEHSASFARHLVRKYF